MPDQLVNSSGWGNLADHAAVMVSIIGFMAIVIMGLLRGWWSASNAEIKALWEEIKAINIRQLQLRSDIPRDYVTLSQWRETHHERMEALQRIEDKLDLFIESCRTGRCLLLRQKGDGK